METTDGNRLVKKYANRATVLRLFQAEKAKSKLLGDALAFAVTCASLCGTCKRNGAAALKKAGR